MLGLYGGADSGIPVDTVEKMRGGLHGGEEVLRDSRSIRIRRTPSTPTTGPSYRKDPAEDGWARMLAFLKAQGVA